MRGFMMVIDTDDGIGDTEDVGGYRRWVYRRYYGGYKTRNKVEVDEKEVRKEVLELEVEVVSDGISEVSGYIETSRRAGGLDR